MVAKCAAYICARPTPNNNDARPTKLNENGGIALSCGFCRLLAQGSIELVMPERTHRSLFIPGPAGRLDAILWTPPPEAPKPPFAAVVCHPHPLYSGTMHNKVVYQVNKTLDRLGLPVLRFNFR